jgi:hypothetical protein
MRSDTPCPVADREMVLGYPRGWTQRLSRGKQNSAMSKAWHMPSMVCCYAILLASLIGQAEGAGRPNRTGGTHPGWVGHTIGAVWNVEKRAPCEKAEYESWWKDALERIRPASLPEHVAMNAWLKFQQIEIDRCLRYNDWVEQKPERLASGFGLDMAVLANKNLGRLAQQRRAPGCADIPTSIDKDISGGAPEESPGNAAPIRQTRPGGTGPVVRDGGSS